MDTAQQNKASFGPLDGIGEASEGISLPLQYRGRILYNLCRNLIFTTRVDEDDNSADENFAEHVLDPVPFDSDDEDGEVEYYCAANDRVAVKIREDHSIYIILKDQNTGKEKSFFALQPDGVVGTLETRLPLYEIDPRACHELLRVATSLVTDLFEEQKRMLIDKHIFAVREHLAPFFGWIVPDAAVEKS